MNELRVSIATYNQVRFIHPQSGVTQLALERKATVHRNGSVSVRAQPLGGGVRVLNPEPLREMLGELRFDSEHSEHEKDFRILIHPSQWESVKQYSLLHLRDPDDLDLESSPNRELVEEFEETMGFHLKPDQYAAHSLGFVIEDEPRWTENWYAPGFPTVRIYRIYRVDLLDPTLCQLLMKTSQQVSDQALAAQALHSDTGRANTALALPLHMVKESYLSVPIEKRFKRMEIELHTVDESTLAVLPDVPVRNYWRQD